MLKPGDAAPDFVLKDADGQDFRLSSLLGKWVMFYFYPKDFTAQCTIEAKAFRDHYEEIAENGASVVGVSLDDSESHCNFRDKHHLPFTLVSDPEGRVHDLYGAWRTTLLGRNSIGMRRCSFLIDPVGIVRKVYTPIIVIGHVKEILRDLEQLKSEDAAKTKVVV